MEEKSNYRTSLHVINPVLQKPVKRFQEQEDSKLGYKAWTKVIPENKRCMCNCVAQE